MPAIVRPKQPYLFSDRPRGAIQADLLDAQIHNLVESIRSTQTALEEIRRDDGKLKNNSVGRDQLQVDIKHSRQEIDSVEQRMVQIAEKSAAAAAQIITISRDIDLRASDAEAAAVSAAKSLSAVAHDTVTTFDASSDADNSADRAESAAIQSENSANYSLAQSDNAIAARNEATQWAEYLAGPVVDPNAAPAYIQNHPFGHGLYYQPVEGGLAGLWSAKWWALYAQNLVGNVGFYYLGPSSGAPVPGSVNPITGQPYPNPLATGSFYYDTSTTPPQVFFWNGSSWTSAIPTLSAGYTADYVYIATAGQTVFSGPDNSGFAPNFTTEGHDCHVNGVRLVSTVDFTVNSTAKSLTLVEAPGAGAVVQWSLLVPGDKINSAQVDAFKVEPLIPDGSRIGFPLNYVNPDTSAVTPCNVGTGAQLQVSQDGVIQEPNVDYVASGAILTMTVAPSVDAKMWAIWFRPHIAVVVP